eukprot:5662173-Prymnesium_polylepis.1
MEDVLGGGVAEAATLIRGVLVPVANVCCPVEQLAVLPLFGGVGEWGAKIRKHLVERDVGPDVGLPGFDACEQCVLCEPGGVVLGDGTD